VGETVAVVGLGLVGLLTAQLLKAAGCQVVGIDPAPAARARARSPEAATRTASPEQAAEAVAARVAGAGADAVIICAAAPDSAPVQLAGELARSRGRVVMVGATGMEIPRELYFRKELTFALSRSYGPGRYDRHLRGTGLGLSDRLRALHRAAQPAGVPRSGRPAARIAPEQLTTHRFALDQDARTGLRPAEGPRRRPGRHPAHLSRHGTPRPAAPGPQAAPPVAGGDLGWASWAPANTPAASCCRLLRRVDHVALRGIATRQPAHGLSAASRFGFAFAGRRGRRSVAGEPRPRLSSSPRGTTATPATRRTRWLPAGMCGWRSRSPCSPELQAVAEAVRAQPASVLAIGFNRRCSPLVQALQQRLPEAPRLITCRINAGYLPPDHWTHDPVMGGGRLLGEGCHFFDLLCCLAGAPPVTVHTVALATDRRDLPPSANFAATVQFANGAVGQLQYSSAGPRALPKERVEVLGGGAAAVIEDFTRLTTYDHAGVRAETLRAQDKGQAELLRRFVAAARGQGSRPLETREILVSSALTLAAQDSLTRGAPVPLQPMLDAMGL
jgi:predicted dehydrogenase